MNLSLAISNEIIKFFKNIEPNVNINDLIGPLPPAPPNLTESPEALNKRALHHNLSALLERFATYKKRHISSSNRRVFYSKEIREQLKNTLFDNFNTVISSIENDLKYGIDVNGRLSKLVDRLGSNDAMLYEWNLYHFHLGSEKESSNSKYYTRSGPLLIVYIPLNQTSAYFVKISDNHSNNVVFSKSEYLKIIMNNWPELFKGYELKGVKALEYSPTDDQRKDLRKAGISCLDEINGKVLFSPGGGQTTAGTSINCRMLADKALNDIHSAQINLIEKERNFIPKSIIEFINFDVNLNTDKLNFEIILHEPHKPDAILNIIKI